MSSKKAKEKPANRDKSILVRVRVDELGRIKESAKAADLPVSDYMRKLALRAGK